MTATPVRTRPRSDALTTGRLPRRLAWAVGAGSVAVGAFASALTGTFHPGVAALIGAVVFLGVIHAASTAVEGHRRAVDRLAHHTVVGMFLLALLPLVSVAWTALAGGIRRFDLQL